MHMENTDWRRQKKQQKFAPSPPRNRFIPFFGQLQHHPCTVLGSNMRKTVGFHKRAPYTLSVYVCEAFADTPSNATAANHNQKPLLGFRKMIPPHMICLISGEA